MWPFTKRQPPLCTDCMYCVEKNNRGEMAAFCMREQLSDESEHFCSVERGDYGYQDRCGPEGRFFTKRPSYADRVP